MSTTSVSDEGRRYLHKVEEKIMAVSKRPPKTDGLKVSWRYNLAHNGSVSAVRVEKSSGNQMFDDSAIQAVRRASPFHHHPNHFRLAICKWFSNQVCRFQRVACKTARNIVIMQHQYRGFNLYGRVEPISGTLLGRVTQWLHRLQATR